ncbi:related to ribosomal protein YmL49 [Cephalotrichum gorgonifer]|uniref:Large ribosomal subunit protein bL21m n=1 Tax=Cephalotrichum gorgonifer TaxID=2041049 RepID=A0AAE8SX02_9PEZI|nr:related to ribosomal protein YmL49 [Cephalotrichum gorgonifer]
MSRTLLRSILELRPSAVRQSFFPTRSLSTSPSLLSATTEQSASTTTATPTPPTNKFSPTAHKLYPPEKPLHKPLSPQVRSLLPVLAAQPSHYATVHIHGNAYLVTPGDHIRLPFRMPGIVPGAILRLTRASVLGSRDLTLRGTPYVDERLFDCKATVLGVEAEPMRLKVKTKRRNRKKKTVRSKHKYTVLGVTELRVKGPEEIDW